MRKVTTEKFLKALNAMDKLRLVAWNGRGMVGRRDYNYDFRDKPVDVVLDQNGNIKNCTCKNCSVKQTFDCSYILGIRLFESMPPNKRMALIPVIIRETKKLK